MYRRVISQDEADENEQYGALASFSTTKTR